MKILGISSFYHDSAAALLEDGKVLCASMEERFTRIKHDSDFPLQSIKFCLKSTKTKATDLDYVVFYEKPFLKFERVTLSTLATVPNSRSTFTNAYRSFLKSKLWIKSIIAKELKVDPKKILFIPHHLSHAASSYYSSDFEESALLTIDGVGEWTTTAWGTASGNKIKLNQEIQFPHSLGLLYSVFTQYLGFHINNGEFKVMGLAPYGKPTHKKTIEKMIKQNKDGSFKLDMSFFKFHTSEKVSYSNKFIKTLGLPPAKPENNHKVDKNYANIAASIQEVLEEKIVTIANHIQKKTKQKNLCYAGGVALNGVANWKVLTKTNFQNLYIHPSAGDSGGAVGAAQYVHFNLLNNPKTKSFFTPYLGLENSEDEIKKLIKNKKLKAKKYSNKNLAKFIAKSLAKQKVVGLVQGKAEWGPRALGNRSILADPRSKEMKDLVNSKIKFREPFRPFAPVCQIEKAAKYFELGKHKNSSIHKYMISVVPVKKSQKKKLGAITHVNTTARPQFISKKENPVYYDIISEFGKITNVYVVLNTSFNLKGEPIVNTAKDAFKTFSQSGIDILVLGNWVIQK